MCSDQSIVMYHVTITNSHSHRKIDEHVENGITRHCDPIGCSSFLDALVDNIFIFVIVHLFTCYPFY